MPAARIYGLLAVLVLVANLMVAIFVYAYTSDRFTIRNISFTGCRQINEKQLERIIRHSFPSSILRIDLGLLKSRLEDENWIKSAEIRRILPTDLVVNIVERAPAVILEISGELMVADIDGILLDNYHPKYGKLDVPVFRGLMGKDSESFRLHQQENSTRIRRGLSLLSELESGSSSYSRMISEIDLSDPDNLTVMLLDDDAEVYLGKEEHLKRFQTLMRYMSRYQEQKAQYDIASIDMRFTGKIIYELRGVHSDLTETLDEH